MKKSGTVKKVLVTTLAASMLTGGLFPCVPSEVRAAEQDEWNEIEEVVGRYYGEWTEPTYPGLISNSMPETALLGNGDVGVTSGGNSNEKTFYVSKGDFWAQPGLLALGGVTIREEQVKEETGENLALNYERVSADETYLNFYPENAVNGTMKDANDMWCTDIGKEHWLQLDFAQPISVARWVLKFDEALRPGLPDIEANTASDFRLQISEDGETWKDVSSVVGNKEVVFDQNLEQQVTAQHIRVYFTKPTQETTADSRQNPRARVAEFELYADPKEEMQNSNLALQKPVEVSSQWSGEAKGTLVDGDVNTQWTSSAGALNAEEHWAIIDLGEEKEIGYWVVRNSKDTDCATSDFKLQYSSDRQEWKEFANVTGNTEVNVSGTLDTPVKGQFVRLSITKGTKTDNSYARIKELELYKEYTEIEEKEFYEKEDILNAEIQTKQTLGNTSVQMTTWLAANENIMVTELASESEKTAALEVETWASNNQTDIRPISAENDEDSVTVKRTSELTYPDDEDSWITEAALSTKVIGAKTGETSSDADAGKGIFRFSLDPGEKVYIVTAVGGGGRTYTKDGELWENEVTPVQEAQTISNKVGDEKDVQELNQERQSWWKDYWSASYVNFGTEDERLNQIQKYYYGGQYILGSTVREGKLAPGLYGVWRMNDTPYWGGDYHMNYNFMASFYGTYSSNRPEMSLPAADLLFSYMETGEKRAASTEELRKLEDENHKLPFSVVDKQIEAGKIDPVNGIKDAILYPVGIAPWGKTFYQDYWNETMDASYNSYLLTQYYDYTLDESILEQTYDYLKKCANFYEGWLIKEDGRYNLYAGWCEGFTGKNPACELAAMQNVFKHLLQMSEKLGKDADKRETWKEIYEDISVKPTWVTNGKTTYALAEKRYDGESGETDYALWGQLYSNVVMLDYFLPGDSLGYFSSPEELQIARDTIDVFDTNSRGNWAWNNANNFPRVFADAVRARYDIDTVINHLYENVSGGHMAKNLRIVDGYHGVEKSGATEAINSMMLASDKGITKIFPNWYADKDAKFANLRAKGAFTVSAEYDGTAQEAKNVTVTSEAGEDMTLVSPWAEGMTVKDSKGNIVETTKGTVPNWEDTENATYTFATTAGETYTVEKGETEPEKPSKNTLEYFLNEAKEHQANGDVDSCVESVKKLFEEAIAECEAVMVDEDATYDEIQKATVKLMKAIQALDMKAADKTDLQMAVDLANSIDLSRYVEAGQAEFTKALEASNAVLADPDAMKEDTNAAWDVLVTAMSNLRLKADKSTLEDLLNSVKDLDLSQYTEESVAVFRSALAKGEAVLTDESLSEDDQKIVDTAVKALTDAKEQLQPKNTSTGNADDNNATDNGGSESKDTGNSGISNTGDKADVPKTGVTETPSAIPALAGLAVIAGAIVFRRRYF